MPLNLRDRLGGYSSYHSSSANSYFTDPDLEQRLRDLGYGDYVDANPWRNFEYNESGWQKLLSALGFRTNYDTARENARFQSLEYLSNVNDLAQQNLYNSEDAKVQRMRSAGENPDLLGTGDVANSAGLPEETNNTLPNVADDPIGALSSIGSGLMNAFTGAVGIIQSLAGIKNTRLVNQGLEIGNANDLVTGAKSAVSAVMPDLSEFYDEKGVFQYDRDKFTSKIMASINSMYNPESYDFEGKPITKLGNRMSKKMYNQFFQAASAIAHSAPAKAEGLQSWIDQLKSGSEFVETDSSKYYNYDPSVLYEAFKPLIAARDQLKQDMAKYEADYQSKMTEVGGDYMASLDITGKEQIIEGQQFENISKEYQAVIDRAEGEAMRILQEKADAGDTLAQTMLIVYSATGSFGNLFSQFFKGISF